MRFVSEPLINLVANQEFATQYQRFTANGRVERSVRGYFCEEGHIRSIDELDPEMAIERPADVAPDAARERYEVLAFSDMAKGIDLRTKEESIGAQIHIQRANGDQWLLLCGINDGELVALTLVPLKKFSVF